MIHIFYHNRDYTNYILQGISNRLECKLIHIPVDNRIKAFCKALDFKLKTSFFVFLKHNQEINQCLKSIKPNDIVILFDIFNPNEVHYFTSHLPFNQIKIWLWNTVDKVSHRMITQFSNKSNVSIHTFDQSDAVTYNLTLHHQIYNQNTKPTISSKNKFDFFFIGADKGRSYDLERLSEQLNEFGYSTKFIVINRKLDPTDYPHLEIRSSSIPYENVIKLINESSVIVDFTKNGQSGITLRGLESIFFEKKILTNNHSITDIDIPQKNILLIRESALSKKAVENFMAHKTDQYPEDIKRCFSIDHWLKEIIH